MIRRMEFYNEKDMEYWRKQAEEGNAVILEIPVDLLLDLDLNKIRMPEKKNISPEELQAILDIHLKEYEKTHAPAADAEPEHAGDMETEKKKKCSDDDKVTRIMAETSFSDEQIAVIARAMMDQLPARYLLCFLKKEYSPAIMQQMYEYCKKMYTEEITDSGS